MNIIHFVICTLLILVPLVTGSNTTETAVTTLNNITDFFPEIKGNLTKITWAHAVNSQELLQKALNGSVMMLEADVVLGNVKGKPQLIPIMAHPPQNVSDLSLQEFVQKVQDFNTKGNNTNKKGIKLDFKSIEAVEASDGTIKDLYSKMNSPFWINADILKGPSDSQVEPVSAAKFFKVAKKYPNATLSIGWITYLGNGTNNASYTNDQVDEMLNTIENNSVTQLITFPVRAGIAAQSLKQLTRLVNNITTSTLTLWNGAEDSVDIESLRKLIADVGIGRVYIDLPDELKNKLRLDDLGGVSAVKPFALLIVLFTVILKMF